MPADGVTVHARVRDETGVRHVAVTVVPRPGIRIPGRPGVTVAPRGNGRAPAAVHVAEEADYFAEPPAATLRLTPGEAVTLEVDYAYCVSDARCYLAQAVVEIPAGDP